jgi:hypothetical protein
MMSDPLHDNTYLSMKDCKSCNNYGKLYINHAVYCDEPGDAETEESNPFDCDGKRWTSFLEPNSWNHMSY